MPQIPTTGRQVQEGVFNAPQVSARAADLSTGRSGQALTGLLDHGSQVIQREQGKANAAQLDAFETSLREEQNRLIHDKESGFYNKRGGDTLQASVEYEEQFNKFKEEGLKGLGNTDVRRQASLLSRKYQSDFKRQVDGHTSRQMEQHHDGQYQANMKSLMNDAALNYKEYSANGSSKVQANLDQLDVATFNYAERKGMSQEQLEALRTDTKSQYHEAIVKQAINNGEDLRAMDYYKSVADGDRKTKNAISKNLNAETSLRLEGMVRDASIRGESQRTVDKIMEADMPYGEARKQIRENTRPEVREKALRLHKERHLEKEFIREEKRDTEAKGIIDHIRKYQSDKGLTPEQHDLMKDKKFSNAIGKIRELQAQGFEVTTSPGVKNKLMDLLTEADANPKVRTMILNKLDPFEYILELSPRDLDYFIQKKAELKKGILKGKDAAKLKEHRSTGSMIKSTLAANNVTNKEKQAEITNRIHAEISQRQEKGEVLKPSDTQAIADYHFRKVKIENETLWIDREKPIYELTEKDRKKIMVPADYSQKATEILRKLGRKPTRDNILKMYMNKGK